jgi:predicted GNAT family N-acyltransferase
VSLTAEPGGTVHLNPQRMENVTVVRTVDDLMRAASIRSIVYIGDQDCPFDEEFDGNDLCGMHLLGWVGEEPAACLRLRFFGGFAKLERLAVRPDFRRSTIAFAVVRKALQIAARKGYRKAYGHARIGLEPFWMRFGARAMGPAGAFSFSGEAYTEMLLELPPTDGALDLGADPLVLNRPEGDWDQAGVLEAGEQPSAAPPRDIDDGNGEASPFLGWSADVRDAWAPWTRGFAEAAGDPFAYDSLAAGAADTGHKLQPEGAPRRSTRRGREAKSRSPRRFRQGLHDVRRFEGYWQTRTRRITTVS